MEIYVVTWAGYSDGGVVWCGTDKERALRECAKSKSDGEATFIEVWKDGEFVCEFDILLD